MRGIQEVGKYGVPLNTFKPMRVTKKMTATAASNDICVDADLVTSIFTFPCQQDLSMRVTRPQVCATTRESDHPMQNVGLGETLDQT